MKRFSKLRTAQRKQAGGSIVETMIASVILLIGIVPVMALFTVAAGKNASQGDIATRTVEYSQDKTEQLLALSFNDGSTDTAVYPAAAAGGQGLGGTMAASSTVGGTNPAAPVAGYVDYLDFDGNLVPNSGAAFYTRVWSISTDATGFLKTIQVVTAAKSAGGDSGKPPSTTVVSAKASSR